MPAAFLGRFSRDQSRPSRERPLWVRDNRSGTPFKSTADKLARVAGLYDYEDAHSTRRPRVDDAWGYESSLPDSLNALTDADAMLDGAAWASTLVPFVAGLFVRGTGFHHQFAERFPTDLDTLLPGISVQDNATQARLIDLQLVLAPIMASRWTVHHFPPDTDLVTSDTGSAAATVFGHGYVVPIDRFTALVLTWKRRKQVLSWTGTHWVTPIEHVTGPEAAAAELRQAMGAFAEHAVYGPTKESVEDASVQLGSAPRIGPSLLGGAAGGIDLGCHQYDYFRILSALHSVPADTQAAVDDINWSAVQATWTGPVAVEVLFPDRTTGGVSVEGESVILDLAHGIRTRKARRAAGDFRTGAMFHADLPFNDRLRYFLKNSREQ